MSQSNPSVGGRGRRAPYTTTHIRIPSALKPTVEVMAANYKELVSDYDSPFDSQLIARALGAVATEQTVLEQPQVLNDEFKELVCRILKQSLGLKANASEDTKEKIREIIALLS